VGYSTTRDGRAHAFAYKLGEPDPKMIDLGTLGRALSSRADDVEGGWVLGASPPATFADNLNSPKAMITDIGSLGAGTASLAAADGGWAVGNAGVADGAQHAYAYNYAAPHPHMIDLGTLGGRDSAALAVADGWAAGTAATPDGRDHVFACDLNAPHRRLVDLGDNLAEPGGPDTTAPVVVGSGWVVAGPVVTRGGFAGDAWAVKLPARG
jgi:probable HAF family extracellular repeat protein